MKELVYVILILLIGAYTLACLRTDGWRKMAIPVVLCCIYLCFGWTYFSSGGTCRASWLNFLPTNMTVFNTVLEEPKAIYLFGLEDGAVKCITLPWEKEKAEKVHGLNEGGQPFVYDQSFGHEEMHPPPIEAMPPKSY